MRARPSLILVVVAMVATMMLPTPARAVAQAVQATQAVAQHGDPAIGPHALDQLRHPQAQLSPDGGVHALAATRAAATRAQASSQSRLSKEVFGFAPYWALSSWTEWPQADLSTLAYFGVTLDSAGNPLTGSDPGWTGYNSADLGNLINVAHAWGNRVLLTVKVFNDTDINSIVSNGTNAQTAISQSIALMQQRGFDGITVDFEGLSSPSYPNLPQQFTNWVGSLTAQTHAAHGGSEVVVAAYSGSASWTSGFMNIGALSPNTDAFYVMAYDMYSGNLGGAASANAPLYGWTYNDTAAVQQYLSQTPASKIILGVPYYGYKWSVTGPVPNAPATSGAAADSYSGIFGDFACASSLSQHWDATAVSPYSTWYSPASGDPCGANYNSWRELYWDNITSLGAKYDLVRSSGIRGTGPWALGYDTGHAELWQLIAQKFTGSVPQVAMSSLPVTESARNFPISWADVPGNAPSTSYTVWQNDNGAGWRLWSQVYSASAIFTGAPGHTYAFYVQGSNAAGSGAPPGAVVSGTAQTSVSSSAPNPMPFNGLYALDAYGDLNGGSSPPLATPNSSWNWAIARAAAAQRGGTSGYVLDGYGALHPFGGAIAQADQSTHSWPGWDVARDVALRADGVSGYVLDAYGGLHAFGGAGVQTDQRSHYWGWPAARRVVLRSDGASGYVLDLYGGLHAFGGAPDVDQSTHYWPGWDIARGVALTAGGQGGYVLDGYGGLHAFGAVSAVGDESTHYWPGWDIASDLVFIGGGAQGYVVDGYGGLHGFGGAPAVTSAVPYYGQQLTRAVIAG